MSLDCEVDRLRLALERIEKVTDRAEPDSDLGQIHKIAQRGLYGRLLTKDESMFDAR